MKKTWKQWIAIACAFTMIAGILPAAVLADEEAATPTNLAAASEEIQEEPGEEIPGEEPAEKGPCHDGRILADQCEIQGEI